jgi:hypothetical protein
VTDELPAGLYETVITEALAGRLTTLDARLVQRLDMRSAEAADRIAQLLARQIENALDAVSDKDRVAKGIEVAQRLLAVLDTMLPRTNVAAESPLTPGRLLSAIGEWMPNGCRTVRYAQRRVPSSHCQTPHC